jgi:hypothetical protein
MMVLFTVLGAIAFALYRPVRWPTGSGRITGAHSLWCVTARSWCS